MNLEKTIIGNCPICGADVIKTHKGYACVNSLDADPKCSFFLFSTVGNRRLSDSEAKKFLSSKRMLLDGLITKDGKNFSSVISFNEDGTVNLSSQIGVCPKCQGSLYVNSRAVSCSNFKDRTNPCKFTIWRNIGGHDLSLEEIQEILSTGATSKPVDIYDSKGNHAAQIIGLNSEMEVVKL